MGHLQKLSSNLGSGDVVTPSPALRPTSQVLLLLRLLIFLLSWEASPLLLPLSPHSSSFKQVIFLLASSVSPSSSPAPSPFPSDLSPSLQEFPLTGFLLSVFHLVTLSNAGYSSLIQISRGQAIYLESPPKGKKILPASLVTLETDQVALWSGWEGEERFAFMWAIWTHVNRTMLTSNSPPQPRPRLGPRAFSSLGIIITTTGVIAQEIYNLKRP